MTGQETPSKVKWPTKDRFGPRAMTLEEALSRGYTEGPFYHGSPSADDILKLGFRSKGAKRWQLASAGEVEEFERWGTVDPVMFMADRDKASDYGRLVLCYAKKGSVKDAERLTIAGGFYVTDPMDLAPIVDFE